MNLSYIIKSLGGVVAVPPTFPADCTDAELAALLPTLALAEGRQPPTVAEVRAQQAALENPPPPAPVVPETVTMRQARLALLQGALLGAVNTAVANMPGAEGDAARIEWEFSSTVERHRPLVAGLAAALGLTDQQLDDLFILAATL